ncbi:hypothetical protein [Cupriavidus oxalaticus]|jgi:hypothetical protein|uniref:Uncharacterized protein n=1 Tax=Cupriavidus oxalaticus TaxID=96344 RepID=A0A375GDY6_9BURK|nr:hypothetical protein [Cupriavidus oxalaticus]QEZ44654.1 hypothetical protein D2917_10670 [Cupriavidus oxalaticus]QRQ83981.1 hypothetical protein JTE91_09270 [Cupriavidus oxalaticus]QRQ91930.1 hypothetical protein JTE92_03075 [Cupriavidus oxalaticus]WQD86521.1 hypothetical protein U0036_21175 [Cupriavidus oxalaticus]SPC17600.1 conserved hypothetical protein [Cupriavidus oxalaticus]
MPAKLFRPAETARGAARMRACLAILWAGAFTGACAILGGNAMQDIFDSWKNVSVDEAKRQWGPPHAVQAMPSGTAYVWNETIPAARAPGSGPRDAGMERTPTPGHCQRKLIAGPDGIVIGGEWSGDACCISTLIGHCAALKYRGRG